MLSIRLSTIVFVCLLGCAGMLRAQDDEREAVAASSVRVSRLPFDSLQLYVQRQPLPHWYDFALNLPRNMGSFASLSVQARSIPTIAGLSALTVGLFATDNRTNLFSRGAYRRSRTVSSVSDFFVSVGDGRSPLLLAGTLGAYGFVASDHRALRAASQTVEALLATGVVVQTLKHIAGRESPGVATSDRGTWRPFPSFLNYDRHQSRYYAFPSGHIATTMATVTVLIENYPEAGWLRRAGYAVTGLVGIGLVNEGWHWYSDLPLGAALGYAFGEIVSHSGGEAIPADQGEVKLAFAPLTNERGNGLLVAMSF